MQGETNRAIADKLFLSVKTIDNHVYNIYKKTGAKNRIELSNMIKLK
jgi:DNA-binding NarL/FixJ family response regulator